MQIWLLSHLELTSANGLSQSFLDQQKPFLIPDEVTILLEQNLRQMSVMLKENEQKPLITKEKTPLLI